MPRGTSGALGTALVVLLLGGCASTGGGGGGGGAFGFLTGGGGEAKAWELAATSYPSQRLYRVEYQGPKREAKFKLTLYLVAESEYRMQASDSLGRNLWSLDVAPSGNALWLDHRARQFCHLGSAESLDFLPLARLPLVALPRLLLGRLPAEPAVDLRRGDGYISYLDTRGQRWSGRLDGESLEWWSLEDAGEKTAWWRREENGGTFTHRITQQQLRWRQVVGEPLGRSLEPLDIPGRFREGVCGAGS